MKKNFQYDYANLSESVESLYDTKSREIKANKTILILKNYLKDVSNLKLLDIGCSTGIMTKEYAKHFSEVTGVDIDSQAIKYASRKYKFDNLIFKETPIEENTFNDQIFDVITCSHIYEHVPSDINLMSEIFRLLKPGGVCYFAAGNRFQIIEPHYKLPFLSYFPKSISNLYIRLFTKEKEYYETHKSLKNLKKLVNKFEIIDYTLDVLKYPTKYSASEMLKENTIKYHIVNLISKIFYFLVPTYIWILKKPE